jgi:hypothetical protein
MGDITSENREAKRAMMVAYYKLQLNNSWSQLESEWPDVYAYDDGGLRNEPWPGSNLWSTRYGSLSASEGIDDTGALTTTSADDTTSASAERHGMAGPTGESEWEEGYMDAAASRSGLAARLTNDGIDAIKNMTDAKFDEWAYDAAGNWHGNLAAATHPVFGVEAVFEKLKTHLRNTSGQNGEDNVANTLSAGTVKDGDLNMLTGNLKGRANEEEAAAPTPPDTPTTKISRAGIAYDTVEYREQCFLLSQIFHVVQHRIDVLNEEEHKNLPYIEEGQTVGTGDNKKKVVPTNSSIMIDALTPYAFINRLTQYREQQTFIDLPNADLSQLQPKIRLYRVTESRNASTTQIEEISKEMLFDTSTTRQDLEEFMKPAGKRGFGAGIKSFNVNYEASNPFALKKSISAELTIFANTFDELILDRGGYAYIDLALKTGGRSALEAFDAAHGSRLTTQDRATRYNLSKLNFRLKAVVGWSKPPGVQGLSSAVIADTLSSSFITINLTPTIHTFDFDEMGRVTFKIQYLAYIDDFFDEPSYSIFSDYKSVEAQKERELQYKMIRDTCDSDALSKFKEKQDEEVVKELADSRASLWELLQEGTNLRYINLKYSSLRKYSENPAYFDLKKAEDEALDINNLRDAEKGLKNGLESAVKEYQDNPTEKGHGHKDKKNANSTQQVALVYFYVSDLVDIILKSIDDNLDAAVEYYTKRAQAHHNAGDIDDASWHDKMKKAWGAAGMADSYSPTNFANLNSHQKAAVYGVLNSQQSAESQDDLYRSVRLKENFRRYRAVFGPIEILNMANPGESLSVNIGDLPISYRYFMEWLTGRTLAKDRTHYPISAFLNDFINGLIKGFVNDGECFKRGTGQSKQKTTLCQTAITAYNRQENTSDVFSEMLAEYRVRTKERTSHDTNRLHLYYHDAGQDGTASWRPIDRWPILEVSGPPGSPVTSRGLSREINYICYYAGRNSPNERMNGDPYEDMARGVMHYTAGKDAGIVKTIKFQKTEAPGLKEVRYEQDGYDGLAQLREVYNVTIDTYANVSAFPGSYIFVNPLGLAPNMTFSSKIDPYKLSAQDMSTYGIGGYYMIVRSSHSFGPGIANTRLDAVWVASIGNDKKPEGGSTRYDTVDAGGNAIEKLTKCKFNEGVYSSAPANREKKDGAGDTVGDPTP